MLLNHVLSSSLPSSIFSAIFDYFTRYAPRDWRVEVSVKPIKDADIRHYHRPQLERALQGPSVVTVHHDLADPNPSNALSRFLPRYSEASLVVCLNAAQQRRLAATGVTRTVRIPHGYNHEVLRVRGPETFSAERARLGFFSNRYRTRFKGEAYLEDLAKRLSPSAVEFLCVGEGRGETAAMLQRLGYEVRSFEYLPYRLFQSLYESIDYLLMCSNFEGGPANLPEALGTGTPAFVTPVGFAPELVEDGVNGLHLSGDADFDAERILALLRDTERVQALRAGASSAAARASTWKQVVEQHFALYTTMLAMGDSHA